MGRVGSYPTFSPLLRKAQRYLSVALVLRSPSAGVTCYPCPVEPGLSSPARFHAAAAAVRPGRGDILPQPGSNVNALHVIQPVGGFFQSQNEGDGIHIHAQMKIRFLENILLLRVKKLRAGGVA